VKRLLSVLIGVILLLSVGQVARAFDVELAWDASISPDVSYYSIHYGTQSGVYGEPINVGLDFSGWITNLTNGIMHYFAVSCTDIEGLRSGYTNEVFSDGTTVVPDGEPPYPPDTGCYIKTMKP